MIPYFKFTKNTGYIFFKSPGKTGDLYKFSSNLEKIGIDWDVSITNGTYVDIISEPIEISTPKYGVLLVIKIRADVSIDYHTIIKELWVPESCIVRVKNDQINILN